MSAANGWYVDPKNPKRDAYWTGRLWSGVNRPTKSGTPTFPEDGDWVSPSRPSRPFDAWRSRAVAMYIAALVALGSVIGGILLAATTGEGCVPDAYDDSDSGCNTYPYVVAGVSVIVSGLVFAAVVYVVGRLCTAQADAAG